MLDSSSAMDLVEAESPLQTQISKWDMQDPFDGALGQGRVDPFNTYPVRKMSLYVHEILDHGKSSSLRGSTWTDQQKRLPISP